VGLIQSTQAPKHQNNKFWDAVSEVTRPLGRGVRGDSAAIKHLGHPDCIISTMDECFLWVGYVSFQVPIGAFYGRDR